MVIRYAIRMRNGSYMKQEYKGTLDSIWIDTADHPIDADLFHRKGIADRVLSEILSGNTNFLVMYEDDNPPREVVELKIDIEEKVLT